MAGRCLPRDERGQSSVIIIGFAVVVLLLVVVVVDAGAAYLKRQSLDSLADGAALYGADAAAEGRDVYSGGLGQDDDLDLSSDVAGAAVRDYLRSAGAYDAHPGLRVSVAVSGDRLVVEIVAPVDLPLDLPGGPERPTVGATGSAVVRPEQP
jgi:uncharacterized membrane protein